ncbi:GNAT family N-acetyltransferase [Mesorhizobium australicum]|uniref:Protein N-acetyltransferase, RimJ/RimL family n=1 Tax=Mesorhizobium australicum TaxID=536018 RepID=A0A1X7NRA4_9HYPH|nr:GNAT family N-acetyltransferase [Mesorhizobium australicum]SMH40600.1 Protein N-acetyltransferase, RimJ/RimL family [Mesorhizobium australicum]
MNDGRKRLSIPVEGPTLRLRLIDPGDAAYLHGLRTDPAYSRHLSTVEGTVLDQQRWIEAYKHREAAGQELYFIIERHDDTRCGTVRLYDIGIERFTWGSWILDQNKPQKAAVESALLSFGVGFDVLGISLAQLKVHDQNQHAISFYRRFGMTEILHFGSEIHFDYPRTRFEADRATYLAILQNEPRA